MKKILLSLLVLVLVVFTSCRKEIPSSSPTQKYAKAIAGSFKAQDGDITFKASPPIGTTRTWTMLAKNSSFYSPNVFALVRGLEFVTGSAAYNFWSVIANNPVTFPASTAVYSNLTPDEDLRLITETKDANNKVAYLGMLDFNPIGASFPLTIHCFRLGDVLQINTNALTSLPGGTALTITAAFEKAPINLTATKAVVTLTGNAGIPNGTEFKWGDIVYGTSVAVSAMTVPVPSGDYVLYDDLDSKVTGNVVITITEPGGTVIVRNVAAQLAGKGMKMVLSTTKIGWYDSQTINWSDTDIIVTSVDVPIN